MLRFMCTTVACWHAYMASLGVLESGTESSLAGPPYAAVDDGRGSAPYPHAALPHAHDDSRVFAHLPPLRHRVAAAQAALRLLFVNYAAAARHG